MYIYGIKMSSIINNTINVYFLGILILLDCHILDIIRYYSKIKNINKN